MRMNTPKNSLAVMALTTTLLVIPSTTIHAFQNLGTNEDFSDSGIFPATNGYNATADIFGFIILNNTVIGETGTVSVDNNNGLPGQGFENVTLLFQGNATIQGSVGPTNPITQFLFSTQPNPNLVTITLNGNLIQATQLLLRRGANPSGPIDIHFDAPNMIVNANVLRSVNFGGPAGTVYIDDVTTINGTIGSTFLDRNMLDVNIKSTLNMNGDIFSVDTKFTDAAGVLNLGNNNLLLTPVTTSANNQGVINFLGNSTITEDIGAVGFRIQDINITSPNATVVVPELQTIHASNINVNNQATLGLGSQLNVNGKLNIMGGGTLHFNPFSFVVITNDVVTNKFETLPGSVVELDMAGLDLNAAGYVISLSNTTPVIDPNTTVRIINPGYYPEPQSLGLFIDIGVNNGATLPATLTAPLEYTSLLSRFSVGKVGNALNINMSSIPTAVFANQPNTVNLALVLDQMLMTQPTGALRGITSSFGSITDADALRNALATLAPIVDGAFVTETFENQHQVFGYVDERMSRINFWRNHLGKSNIGVAAGDSWRDWLVLGRETERGTWAKGFRQHGNQQQENFMPGYRDNAWGIVVGTDNTYNDTLLVGGAISYSYIDTHHHISENAATTTRSVQGMLYTSLDCTSPFFVTFQIGGGYNKYDFTRTITMPTFTLTPQGGTDGWQFGANSEAGYVFDIRNVHVVPSVSAFYSHLKVDGYVEDGAGTANQAIYDRNYDTLVFGAGVKFAQDYIYHHTLIQPEVHAYYYYDVLNETMRTMSSFVGYAAAYETFGLRREPEFTKVGLGLNVFTLNRSTISFSYDSSFNHNYVSHIGFISWRYALAI